MEGGEGQLNPDHLKVLAPQWFLREPNEELDTDSQDSCKSRMDYFYATGQYEQALAECELLESLFTLGKSTRSQVEDTKIRSLLKLQRADEALAILERQMPSSNSKKVVSVDVLFLLATSLQLKGDLEGTVLVFEKILSQEATDPRVWWKLAEAAKEFNLPALRSECLRRIIDLIEWRLARAGSFRNSPSLLGYSSLLSDAREAVASISLDGYAASEKEKKALDQLSVFLSPSGLAASSPDEKSEKEVLDDNYVPSGGDRPPFRLADSSKSPEKTPLISNKQALERKPHPSVEMNYSVRSFWRLDNRQAQCVCLLSALAVGIFVYARCIHADRKGKRRNKK